MNTVNVLVLMIYWCFVGFFYLLAYVVKAGYGLNRLVLFLLPIKGVAALFVYMIVVDIVRQLKKEESEENVEGNKALREEVLLFATVGIRSSTREAFKAKPEQFKVSRRPVQGEIIVPYFIDFDHLICVD